MIDTDTSLYDQIISAYPDAAALLGLDFSCENHDFVFINADCGRIFYPECGFGLILLSCDTENMPDHYKSGATHLCTSIETVAGTVLNIPQWDRGIYKQRIDRAKVFLRILGMENTLSGFSYVAFAAAYMSLLPSATFKADILPRMREIYGKSDKCFERTMRYAVEYAWSNGDIDTQESFFGYSVSAKSGKPSTKELAAMIGQILREEISDVR